MKELEQHELIDRKVYAVVPPKVEYNLTPFGASLIPIISALGQWVDTNEELLRRVISKTLNKEKTEDKGNCFDRK